MKKLGDNFLYLVLLGGKAKKANIELHDVRWVIGSKIEDTYDTLRKDWFGSSKSQGFGLSVILILIYYVMSFLFSSFGVKGILPPIFAAWLPVLISLGGGIYLLRKSSSF